MYDKKAKYYENNFSRKNCMSGIITSAYDKYSIMVGAPCILFTAPFRNRSHVYKLNDSFELGEPNREKTSESKTIALSDLKNLEPSETKEILRNSVGTGKFIFPLDFQNLSIVKTLSLPANVFYPNKKEPIIFEEGKRIELVSLSDVHDGEGLKNFPDLIRREVNKHRYVNYTFKEISKSKVGALMEDLNVMIGGLQEAHKYGISSFNDSNVCRVIINTLSISFYDIEDSIAIFDYKRKDGFYVEVSMTSSEESVMSKGHCLEVKMLFSKSRENLFEIDGEELQLAKYPLITDGVVYINSTLNLETFNDVNIKAKSKSKKAKEE